jgi:phage shock protein C
VNPRRLYRSRRDRQLAGVAGGIAEYLEVDPTVVRILWILSVFIGGFGILLYIIMAFVVPLEPYPTPAGGPWQGPGPAWGMPPAGAGTGTPAADSPAAGSPAAGDASAGDGATGEATGDDAPADATTPDAGSTIQGGASSTAWAPSPTWAAGPSWGASPAWAAAAPVPRGAGQRRGRAGLFFGVLLVVFGAIALVNVLVPGWAGFGLLWPAFIVAIGVALLAGAARRNADDR